MHDGKPGLVILGLSLAPLFCVLSVTSLGIFPSRPLRCPPSSLADAKCSFDRVFDMFNGVRSDSCSHRIGSPVRLRRVRHVHTARRVVNERIHNHAPLYIAHTVLTDVKAPRLTCRWAPPRPVCTRAPGGASPRGSAG